MHSMITSVKTHPVFCLFFSVKLNHHKISVYLHSILQHTVQSSLKTCQISLLGHTIPVPVFIPWWLRWKICARWRKWVRNPDHFVIVMGWRDLQSLSGFQRFPGWGHFSFHLTLHFQPHRGVSLLMEVESLWQAHMIRCSSWIQWMLNVCRRLSGTDQECKKMIL